MQRPTHVRDGAAASWALSRARWPAAATSPPVVSNWLGLIYFCVLYNLRDHQIQRCQYNGNKFCALTPWRRDVVRGRITPDVIVRNSCMRV